MLAIFPEIRLEELTFAFGRHLRIQIADGIGERAAEALDLLIADVRVQVDDAGFQMPGLIRFQRHGKDRFLGDRPAVNGVGGNLSGLHGKASLIV